MLNRDMEDVRLWTVDDRHVNPPAEMFGKFGELGVLESFLPIQRKAVLHEQPIRKATRTYYGA